MKEIPIIDFGERAHFGKPSHSIMQRIEELFVSAPHISREQIRSVAHDMATELEEKVRQYKDDPEKQVEALFQGLDLWTTLSSRSFYADGSLATAEIGKNTIAITYHDSVPPDEVTSEIDENYDEVVRVSRREVETALLRVRDVLLDEVRNLIDPIVVHVAEEALRWNRVFSGAGGEIIKRTKDTLTFPQVYAISITRALRELYKDPAGERCPYIAYTIQSRDTKTGIEIQDQLPLENLGNLTEEGRNVTSEDFYKYIKYFLDNLKGALFLVQKDLGLGDINLYNMGVDTTDGRGKLFDFDYLIKNTIKVPNEFYGYLNTGREYLDYDYQPPGRSDEHGRQAISESEMLYQFAVTLEHLLYRRLAVNVKNKDYLSRPERERREESIFFGALQEIAKSMREEAIEVLDGGKKGHTALLRRFKN